MPKAVRLGAICVALDRISCTDGAFGIGSLALMQAVMTRCQSSGENLSTAFLTTSGLLSRK